MRAPQEFLNIKHNRGPGEAFALEGLWALRRALDSDVGIECVFVCPALVRGPDTDRALALVQRRGIHTLEVSERTLRRMVDRDGPDGLAAIAHREPTTLEDVPLRPDARILIADGFERPGNLGTVIRCADGAGAAAVLLTGPSVRMNHPLVVKASMGTVLSMPVIGGTRKMVRAWLRAKGFTVVAADPGGAVSYRDAPFHEPVAIVLGSERTGLHREWRDAADALVSIPMLGVADSLNVGHAAALLLYEAMHASGGG